MSPIAKLLVPFDLEPCSHRALALAIDLARTWGSELVVLHVWEVPGYAYSGLEFSTVDILAPMREAAERRFEDALVDYDAKLPGMKTMLRSGSPWSEIRDAIREEEPDLVVMGTNARHGFDRFMLGSVAEKTVQTSPSPVLTVH